jgi:hypothetical protein
MDKNHELMGGDIQLFRRPNSKFWYCQATVGGRQRRLSTKKESLRLAENVAKDWFLMTCSRICIRSAVNRRGIRTPLWG